MTGTGQKLNIRRRVGEVNSLSFCCLSPTPTSLDVKFIVFLLCCVDDYFCLILNIQYPYESVFSFCSAPEVEKTI